jgi:hypothetical protein
VNRVFLHYDFEYQRYLKQDPTDTSAFPPSPHKKAFEGKRELREEIRAFLGVVPPLELPAPSRGVQSRVTARTSRANGTPVAPQIERSA